MILLKMIIGSLSHYDVYVTTGGEGFPVYSIWKVQHGFPLYEWPTRGYYQLTLYNVGFYEVYAWLLNILGLQNEKIFLGGRFITLFFTFAGCVGQFQLMRLISGKLSRGWEVFLGLIACCTWFHSRFPGGFYFSVRPDMASLCFSVWGVYFFVRYVAGHRLGYLVFATLLWATAFQFKQACVSSLLGCSMFMLLSGRWKGVAISCAVFAVPTAVVFLAMGEVYRWNILVAPTVNSFQFGGAVVQMAQGIGVSLFLWSFLFALPAWFRAENRSPVKGGLTSMVAFLAAHPAEAALLSVLVFGGALSFVALAKAGSSLNQMQEVLVAAASLSAVCLLRLHAQVRAPGVARPHGLAMLAILSMAPFPVRQLLITKPSPLHRPSATETGRLREMGEFMKTQPMPLFTRDDIFALPWYSNGGNYPAVSLDPVFYLPAKQKGLLEGGGVKCLVDKRYFGSLFLDPTDELYAPALASGYVRKPIPDKFLPYPSSFGPRTGELLIRQE